MNTTALIMMVSTITVITCVTGFFFCKVLTTPPRPEEDSYTDNDEENKGQYQLYYLTAVVTKQP